MSIIEKDQIDASSDVSLNNGSVKSARPKKPDIATGFVSSIILFVREVWQLSVQFRQAYLTTVRLYWQNLFWTALSA